MSGRAWGGGASALSAKAKLFKDQWARKRDQGSASLVLLPRGVFAHFMHWLFHVTALQKSLEQDRHNVLLLAGATVAAR